MNARLCDPEWRSAWGGLPGGEQPHWLDDDELETTTTTARRPAPRAPHDPGLNARGLSVRVGTSLLLDGVDLRLAPGEVGAILGPNGAGKSTLLSVLAGLRAPDAGEVWLNGSALTPARVASLARQRAVLPQETVVAFDFRVREVVALGRYPHRFAPSRHEAGIVQAALRSTGVEALAERCMGSLSGGERARVQLARVMAQIWEPSPDGLARWLLLDEPTAALDLHHQHETLGTVRRWAREQGVGVLAVLHDPNLALRYADQAWVLDAGRLRAAGPPAQVLSPERVQRIWRVRAATVQGSDGVDQLLIAAASGQPAAERVCQPRKELP